MKQLIVTFILFFFLCATGCAQKTSNSAKEKKVGGGCEGCEAIHESPVGFDKIPSIVELPGYNEAGPRLKITGTIYQRDGKTPAPGIILYVYHTDQKGLYSSKGGETGWGKRHGYIRGWVRSDSKGQYTFYTLKPGSYPGGGNPAHIHPTIKETGKSEYWIDEFLFDDDPYLTNEERNRQSRGGNGVLKLSMENGILVGKRDIILGLNVPGY